MLLTSLNVPYLFQESPMPEPSELFTNIYVKGVGAEVILIELPAVCLLNMVIDSLSSSWFR